MVERKQFIDRATKTLLAVGAKPFDDGRPTMASFALATRYGRLVLHIDLDTKVLLGTVFARFDDVKAALETGCNPFSGKWNFHYPDTVTVEAAIRNLDSQLRGIL